jgi:hypothetical protein
MKKTVLIRGIDEEAYRKAKAAAAMKGMNMGRVVSEALEEWSKGVDGGEVEREVERDREFVRKAWKTLAKHRGKSAVVSSGKLQGVFDTYDEASKFASRFKVALTFVVEGPPTERAIEIGPDLELQQGLHP